MSQYKIVLMKPARKFIEKQTKNNQQMILRAIAKLPHEGDIKLLTGKENKYRLRIGGYRVIYSIDNNVLTVSVLDVGNRGNVYK